MSPEQKESQKEFDFGADKFGKIKFVAVESEISGLNLQRSSGEGFIIGDFKSGNFLSVTLLWWDEEYTSISTSVVRSGEELTIQMHDFTNGKVYRLEGTKIYLKSFTKLFEDFNLGSGDIRQHFLIDAPRDIPIVRGELLTKH